MLLLNASAWIGWIIVVTIVFGVAMGAAGAGNQTALYAQAPAEQLGTASGLLRTFGYVGSIASSAITGIVFHSHVTDHGVHLIAWILIGVSAALVVMTIADRALPARSSCRIRMPGIFGEARPCAANWQNGRMPFVLRAATVADIDGLWGMWQEAAENDSRPPDTREAVTALLGRDPDAVIVAEQDGELTGSIIAGWDGWRCHLYRLAVRPAWRRRGVGSALLQAAEERFKALGGSRVDAMVLDSNDLGQNLWRASGYRKQDNWRRWVKGL